MLVKGYLTNYRKRKGLTERNKHGMHLVSFELNFDKMESSFSPHLAEDAFFAIFAN